MTPAKAIWTIGHSTLQSADFIGLLTAHRIGLVADVRRFAASRRHPQFNREILARALRDCGIAYLHFPDLGGRREPAPGSANTGWHEAGFRGYADYMESGDFERAMARLHTAAVEQRTAVMCAEKDWRGCHRGLLSDYLKFRGWQVTHVAAGANAEEHPYTKPARILGGVLTYASDSPAQSQLDFQAVTLPSRTPNS